MPPISSEQEIARLSSALEQRGEGSDSEASKLRKANRVLEAHVEMLRSNLSAAREESSAGQSVRSESLDGEASASSMLGGERSYEKLQAEVEQLRSQNQVCVVLVTRSCCGDAEPGLDGGVLSCISDYDCAN